MRVSKSKAAIAGSSSINKIFIHIAYLLAKDAFPGEVIKRKQAFFTAYSEFVLQYHKISYCINIYRLKIDRCSLRKDISKVGKVSKKLLSQNVDTD